VNKQGYAGEILKINLTNGKTYKTPTSDYADRFLGGRGLAAKLYWDMVPVEAKALSPENCLICVTGPMAGFNGIAGNRWQVCAKTPSHEPEAFSNGNMGGRWGTALKYAGFDALTVQGTAKKPVYLLIHDSTVEIKEASHLWGKTTFDTQDILRDELGEDVSVLTIGPAAENLVSFATMLSDENASGSSGLGCVMGSKKLKAVVVTGTKLLKPAEENRLRQIVEHIRGLRPPANTRPSLWAVEGVTFSEDCWNCGIGCSRQMYKGEKSRHYKSFCQSSHIYTRPSMAYHGQWDEAELLAIRLCDAHGLDTATMQPLIMWLIACYKEGLLSEKETGLPLSKAGSAEFIETLTRKISIREGFGDVLAGGITKVADTFGEKAKSLCSEYIATRANETKDYDPRLLITTALFYATSPRRPINELHGISMIVIPWVNYVKGAPGAFFTTEDFRAAAARFWGSEVAADFSTMEGKAPAAKIIQDRTMAKESLILCDLVWPMMWVNHDGEHVGDPNLESQIYSAVTGNEIDEAGLREFGSSISRGLFTSDKGGKAGMMTGFSIICTKSP
jgi:aldehyde:ferredoxin oxidoreductase